jgi:hypothetical protein
MLLFLKNEMVDGADWSRAVVRSIMRRVLAKLALGLKKPDFNIGTVTRSIVFVGQEGAVPRSGFYFGRSNNTAIGVITFTRSSAARS